LVDRRHTEWVSRSGGRYRESLRCSIGNRQGKSKEGNRGRRGGRGEEPRRGSVAGVGVNRDAVAGQTLDAEPPGNGPQVKPVGEQAGGCPIDPGAGHGGGGRLPASWSAWPPGAASLRPVYDGVFPALVLFLGTPLIRDRDSAPLEDHFPAGSRTVRQVLCAGCHFGAGRCRLGTSTTRRGLFALVGAAQILSIERPLLRSAREGKKAMEMPSTEECSVATSEGRARRM